MLFHLKRSNKNSVQVKKKLTRKFFLSASLIMSLGLESICIVTKDTDILAPRSYFSEKLVDKLYIKMFTNPKVNFREIRLKKKFCEAMHAFHAVTGSNFNNTFHGLDKTKDLNLLRKIDLFSDAFILLGEEAYLNKSDREIFMSIL